MLTGCAGRPSAPATADRVFFVHGAAGQGLWYDDLFKGLREGGVEEPVQVVHWGMPPPMTILNFQNNAVHRKAETKLAGLIAEWRQRHPDARIILIGHSAGGGVILGALKRLEGGVCVDRVVLLNPSVSPGYDLVPSLEHVWGVLHVYHSDRDNFFLRWRTSTFGTYDNIKTAAAGRGGFAVENLPRDLAQRLVQHPYDPVWQALDNDGGHFGSTAKDFAREVLSPLCR